MGKHRLVGLLAIAAIVIVPLHAAGDPVVGVFTGTGATKIVRANFGDIFLEARMDSIGGPIVEITDEPGFNSGPTGRGGKDLLVLRNGVKICQSDEFTGGFSLKVSPRAKSAKLVSNVPGCEGVLKWTATGVPGAAGEPYVEIAPDLNGGSVGAKAGLKRTATLTGSIAGESAEGGTGDITYLTWLEGGIGV